MAKALEIINFYKNLRLPELPDGIKVMNPFKSKKTLGYVKEFFAKYYSDNKKRILIFGINPGRFGAGITGINFTDPVALRENLGINNDLGKKRELSVNFIHKTIAEFGGPEKFYKKFFLTSFSPLGFTKNGKNYNFYDDKKLLEATTPFIVKCTKNQINICGINDVAIILGTGKNMEFIEKINKQYGLFKQIFALEHPRFIMQYRKKNIDKFVTKYLEVFQMCSSKSSSFLLK